MEESNTGASWDSRLAKHLVVRHLQVSFPAQEESGGRLSLERFLPPESEYAAAAKTRLRTVAVVGAGASRPVLDLGVDLGNQLVAEIATGHEAAYHAALARREDAYNEDREQFETRMRALCESSADNVGKV